MKLFSGLSLSCCAGLVVLPTVIFAAVFPKDFDVNDDGFLSGTEITRFLEAAKKDNEVETAELYSRVEELAEENADTGLVPIDKIGEPAKRIDCDFEKLFFVRRTIIDLPVLDCPGLRPKSDGASFTLTDDREGDRTSVSVDAGVGLVLVPPRTFRPDRFADPKSFDLVDASLTAFIEADGDFVSGGANDGFVRTGLKLDSVFAGGPFEKLSVGGAGYYQTDLKFGSSGYGGQLNLIPQVAAIHLNAFTRASDDERHFLIRAIGSADVFHIDDAGGTELSADQIFAWVGGTVGFEFVDNSLWEDGIVLGAETEAFWDVANSKDAIKTKIGVDLLFDESGTVATGLSYTRGAQQAKFCIRGCNCVGVEAQAVTFVGLRTTFFQPT